MNIYVSSAITSLKEKLNAYVALLNYRYINLCIKAELGSLLPVTVIADKEYNLEDVALVFTPDEHQFDIHPKLRDYLQPVIDGIFDVHPEFKLEIKQVENSDDPRDKHLLYTMPEVDKDRHDVLENLTKVFYEECDAEIDKELALHTAGLPELTGKMSAEDIDEIKDELFSIKDEYHDKTKELKQEKLIEIEEAFQRYLAANEGKKLAEDEIDFTKCMRLGQVEE
ncbi:MAG: ribosome recycling factor [Prevotella sp.]|nr:ribosome recycling factor [Prevotella sp.]